MWFIIQFLFEFVSGQKDAVRNLLYRLTLHNILCVKLFQILSTNQIVSGDIADYFKHCTNRYECYANDVDHALLDELLSAYGITLCSARPINAGMIAIVFKGYRASDGKYVAIKMKRRNIEARLMAGYHELRLVHRIASIMFYPFKQIHSTLYLVQGFIDSSDHIMEQCDFRREIQAMVTFNWEISELDNIRDSDKIVTPFVYNADNESRFIVMDFLEGVDCFHIKEQDKDIYLELISLCEILQVLFTTVMHTDPHPGNIIYMNVDGIRKLGIIDFGMHAYIDTEIKSDVASGITSLVFPNNVKPITYIKHLTIPPINIDTYDDRIVELMNREAQKVVDHFDNGTISEQNIIACYNAIKRLHNDFCLLKLNIDMVKLLIALSSLLTTGLYIANHDREKYSNCLKDTLKRVLSS